MSGHDHHHHHDHDHDHDNHYTPIEARVKALESLLVEKGFHELVDFIETDRGAYARFILTGEAD